MNKRRMFFHMISASLLRRRSRMIVALLATAIGATILSGLVTIYKDVPTQMAAQFRNYGANMILTAEDISITENQFQESVDLIDEKYLVGATPYRYSSVRIHEQPISISGTNFSSLQKTSPYWSIEGEWPSKDGQILLGAAHANMLELEVGDVATVYYTPDDLTLPDTTKDFEVVGIVSTGGNEEQYVYVSLDDLTFLTGVSGVYDLAELSVSGTTEQLEKYVTQIDNKSKGVNAALIKRVTASEATVLTKLQALVLLVTGIVLALTMICVTTTMTAVVSERRKEIGLRKAIGASDKSIFMEFMGEGIVLGCVGGILGAFLGYGFALFVSTNVFGSTIALSIPIVIITVIAAIIVTAIACIAPILSATKIDAALVLKGE